MRRVYISLLSLAFSKGIARREFLEQTESDFFYSKEVGLARLALYLGALVQAIVAGTRDPIRLSLIYLSASTVGISCFIFFTNADGGGMMLLFAALLNTFCWNLFLTRKHKGLITFEIILSTLAWFGLIMVLGTEKSITCSDCINRHPASILSPNPFASILMISLLTIFVGLSVYILIRVGARTALITTLNYSVTIGIQVLFLTQMLPGTELLAFGSLRWLSIPYRVPPYLALLLYGLAILWSLVSSVVLVYRFQSLTRTSRVVT